MSMSPFERPTASNRESGVGALGFEEWEKARAVIFGG